MIADTSSEFFYVLTWLVNTLAPFLTAIRQVEGDTAALSDAYYTIAALTKHMALVDEAFGTYTSALNLPDETPPSVVALGMSAARRMKEMWAERAPAGLTAAHVATAMLDMRFHAHLKNMPAADVARGEELILKTVGGICPNPADAVQSASVRGGGTCACAHTPLICLGGPPVPPHPPTDPPRLPACAQTSLIFYKVQPEQIGLTEHKLNAAKSMPPTLVWRDVESTCPELSAAAQLLLAIPPTTASSERVFSNVGYLWSDMRSRLSPQRLRKLLYIYFNRRALMRDGSARGAEEFERFDEWLTTFVSDLAELGEDE